MKTLPIAVLGAAIALTACQTTPPRNAALEEAREAVRVASADPAVNTAAAPELQRARESLASAEQAWNAGDADETRSRAYIARQRATIASEIGSGFAAQETLKQTSAERERIVASARAREAQLAQNRAQQAAQEAAAAQAQAANAQTQAANAQAQAEAERQRAEQQQRQLQEERDRAARMQQDLSALQAKNTDRGVVVTLQDVLFDTGKSDLKGGGVRALERLADVLTRYPERRVKVEGFTDSQGSEDYNMQLAARRAEAVKQQLESLGVADGRVEMRAFGEAYPIADNNTASGRQRNRRVEIVFSDGTGKFPSSR